MTAIRRSSYALALLLAACATAAQYHVPRYTARISGTPGTLYMLITMESVGNSSSTSTADGILPLDSAGAVKGVTVPLGVGYIGVSVLKKPSSGILILDVYRDGQLIGHAQTTGQFGTASFNGR